MKSFLIFMIFLFAFLFLLQIVIAAINFRTGGTCPPLPPPATEICLFTIWNKTNAHAGSCGYYTNFTVCTNEVTSAAIRTACLSGEKEILSFFQINNTNVGKAAVYGQKLCVSPGNYTCAIKNSCVGGQTCMGSVTADSNSHFAECNFYSKQVCCGPDTTPPTITNETINATKIKAGEGVRLTANVTDDFEVSKVIATIRKPDGSLTNFTTSLLSGDLYFLDYTDTANNGIYIWTTTYANDTTNNFATSTPNLQFTVAGITYAISGTVLDALTGEPILTGTAVGIIKETGDRGTGTLNNSRFTIDISTHLDANKTSFTVGVVATGGGKTGYKQLIFGSDPFAEQTQKCANRNSGFSGFAIDSETGRVFRTGTVTASITTETTTVTNSSSFSDTEWKVNVTACVIPGGIYTVDFILTAEGKRIQSQLNVIPT